MKTERSAVNETASDAVKTDGSAVNAELPAVNGEMGAVKTELPAVNAGDCALATVTARGSTGKCPAYDQILVLDSNK